MSNWVMLTLPANGLRAGSLLKAKGNKGKIGDTKVDLRETSHIPLPDAEAIAHLLSEVSPSTVINVKLDTGMYTLVGFKYGFLVEEEVPVYSKGEVVSTRTVRYVNHPRISAKSMNECLRRTFRLAAMDCLYRMEDGVPVQLSWCVDRNRFMEGVRYEDG